MRDSHDTPAPPPAPRSPRFVWILSADQPPAEGAARLLTEWRARRATDKPWLLLAPESRHAAWAEALRALLEAEPPAPAAPVALRRAIRAAADLGGALIAGGALADEGGGFARPALFVNLPPTRALLRAWSEPAPVLGLAPREPHAADLAALAAEGAELRSFGERTDNPPPRVSPSPVQP